MYAIQQTLYLESLFHKKKRELEHGRREGTGWDGWVIILGGNGKYI